MGKTRTRGKTQQQSLSYEGCDSESISSGTIQLKTLVAHKSHKCGPRFEKDLNRRQTRTFEGALSQSKTLISYRGIKRIDIIVSISAYTSYQRGCARRASRGPQHEDNKQETPLVT